MLAACVHTHAHVSRGGLQHGRLKGLAAREHFAARPQQMVMIGLMGSVRGQEGVGAGAQVVQDRGEHRSIRVANACAHACGRQPARLARHAGQIRCNRGAPKNTFSHSSGPATASATLSSLPIAMSVEGSIAQQPRPSARRRIASHPEFLPPPGCVPAFAIGPGAANAGGPRIDLGRLERFSSNAACGEEGAEALNRPEAFLAPDGELDHLLYNYLFMCTIDGVSENSGRFQAREFQVVACARRRSAAGSPLLLPIT